MHRAAKTLLQNGPVDFPKLLRRRRFFNADDDAVGVEKISNRSSLAKKFGVRGHAEFDIAVAGISRERPAEFQTRPCGNRALFDHQLGRPRLRSDLPCHVVDCGKVCLSRFFRGSAHANEDSFSGANSFASVCRVGDVPRLACGSQNLFEMFFINGHATVLELSNAVAINVRANDLVPRLGQAGSGDESDVSTSNDRETQKTSLCRSLTGNTPRASESELYCDRSKRKKKAVRWLLLGKPQKVERKSQSIYSVLEAPPHQQPTQSQQQEARLAADQVPKQARGLVAMNFSERFPRGNVQQVNKL